ncbi:SseB family protein [Dickeya oryzae]
MLSEENNLEKILRRAADEPAHRPEFYQELMESQVFLLGSTNEAAQNGEVNLKAGDKIQIQHWEKPGGAPVVPFFLIARRLAAFDSERGILSGVACTHPV